jgi:hypothetical protein
VTRNWRAEDAAGRVQLLWFYDRILYLLSIAVHRYPCPMRIGKPLLLITTPIGVGIGLYEAHRLAGGLVFLMAAMLGVITAAIGSVVFTIRREKAAEAAAAAHRAEEGEGRGS